MGKGVKAVFQFGAFFGAKRHYIAPGLPPGSSFARLKKPRARRIKGANSACLLITLEV